MLTTQTKATLLLTACVALVACDQEGLEDQDNFEALERVSPVEDIEDGDAVEGSGVLAPETADNQAPCGEQTLMTVHADSGATYVFCGLGDGVTGVLEALPADGRADSLLDVYASPVELLHAVAPADAVVPDELVVAVEHGELAAEHVPAEPLVFGTSQPPVSPHSTYCSNLTGFDNNYGWSGSFQPFVEEFVEDYTDCENHLWYFTNSGSVGWHQRTASSYQVYGEYGSAPWSGACGAKEHVLSCGGSTLFQALRKETPGSSWVSTLNYWVSDGVLATWKMYASDCAGGSDKDDMRYTGDSEPGAHHYYKTIFIKWLDGGFCQHI